MKHLSRGATAGAAALLLSAGLATVGIAPAGAVTTALTPGSTAPWATDTFDCNVDTPPIATRQSFVAGPETPPSGTGSLKFDLSTADGNHTEYFRTAAFDETAISDLEGLSYSTYVAADGDQPPYLRLSADTDGDGGWDDLLYFYPANNAEQQAIIAGEWQTWNVFGGQFNSMGDDGPANTFTLAEWLADPANEDAVLSHIADAPNVTGGITIGQGCAGDGSAGSVTYLDEIIVDVAGDPVAKYDLEATAPARTLTVTPKSGDKGSTVTVSGTDCFEPTAVIGMGQSFGESGDDLTNKTVNTNADGTFSGTLTIPATADPGAKQSVYAFCGTADNEAFRYTSQEFDVTGQPNPTGENGYRMVAADGGIFTFGAREFHGSTGSMVLNKPIVGGATDKGTYNGYWIVASDGGVFTFNAPFYGSLGSQTLASPATEIEPTPTGKGYYIVLANGRVHTFGDANHFGDMSGKPLNKPVIGMSVTPTGKGYWLVGEDGGIFNFGDAGFFGSTGDMKLNAPVIDLAPAVDNNGYYLLAKDGGVFTFGSADFKGSTGSMTLNAPVIAMLVNPTGSGYWLAATDGGIFSFGAGAPFLGSMGDTKLNSPVLDLIN